MQRSNVNAEMQNNDSAVVNNEGKHRQEPRNQSKVLLVYFLCAVFFALILPEIFDILAVSDIVTLASTLVVANTVYAVVAGFIAGRENHSAGYLLIFPILYGIGAYFFFDKYALILIFVYLLFTYLAYGVTKP